MNETKIDVSQLWKGFGRLPNCETCKNEQCKGHLDYDSLCANVKYLKDYAEKNFEKNRETFKELKKIMGDEKPSIFSFGCGVGLDYIGAVENFGERVIYYPIDDCKWAIIDTDNYRNFEPRLPKRIMDFEQGMFMLNATLRNPVLCFFNSIFSITQNTDLMERLVSTLRTKRNFYFVCNYTKSKDFYLLQVELNFIKDLLKELRPFFNFKKVDLSGDKGIIIIAEQK